MSDQEEDQKPAVGDRGEPTRARQEEGEEEEEDSDGKEEEAQRASDPTAEDDRDMKGPRWRNHWRH